MRGNKFEKLHILFLKSETLSREYRVTESAQEFVDTTRYKCEHYTNVYHMSTLIYYWCRGLIFKEVGGFGGCLTGGAI